MWNCRSSTPPGPLSEKGASLNKAKRMAISYLCLHLWSHNAYPHYFNSKQYIPFKSINSCACRLNMRPFRKKKQKNCKFVVTRSNQYPTTQIHQLKKTLSKKFLRNFMLECKHLQGTSSIHPICMHPFKHFKGNFKNDARKYM